jgi:uncharacterized membrane-anchored protein
MKAKIKVQSIQVQYYIKDAEAAKWKIHTVFWSIRKGYFSII